jgi:hypothetical protein
VNDLGFAVRTDRKDVQGNLSYVENKPGTIWRRWSLAGTGRSEHNYAWQPILTFGAGSLSATTMNYWTLDAQASRFFQAIDDRLTRGGPLATRPAWWQYLLQVRSDVRKPVTLNTVLQSDDYEFGGWDWHVIAELGIKTSSRWNLSVGPSFGKLFTPAQFVASVANSGNLSTYGRDYLFAPLHQTALALETRFNATFSPRLSLEVYAQPLLSSQDYGDAKKFVAPQTYAFVPFVGQVPDLDFNLRSLRGNAVLRWEWRQGSTIYVAWQQSRSDLAPLGDFDFSRDRMALFRTRPDNIFVVKASYWLNP